MLFFIDTEEDRHKVFEGDILPYAQKLKQQGTIRGIGASSHNPLIAKKMVETGVLDTLMFSINPAFDMTPGDVPLDDMITDDGFPMVSSIQPERMALYSACEREGVAITVMKTLGSGKLISEAHTPFERPLSVHQCVKYALDRPAVVSALVGCKSSAEVHELMRYFEISDAEKSYAEIIEGRKGSFRGSCVYCGHFQPCPVGIDIASANRYLDIALLDAERIPPSVKQHYAHMPAHGGDCISCGSCEKRCPFGVPVAENMKKAETLFGA
jgi:predicted aldo/keto reductase-like oxidoreductase